MNNRHVKLDGLPWLMPHIIVRDIATAVEFYERAFGFEKRTITEGPGGRPIHAEMKWKDALILMGPESPSGRDKTPATLGGTPVTHYVYVDDVDALYKRATDAGARGVIPPKDEFWGDRVCHLLDPDGHSWMFATHVGELQAVPGTTA